MIISTGLPRKDSNELNDKIYECNILLLHKYLNNPDIHICDNSGMGSRGQPIGRFLSSDGVHLSKQGTSLFASNLISTIREVFQDKSHDTSRQNRPGNDNLNRHRRINHGGRYDRQNNNKSYNPNNRPPDDWGKWSPPPYFYPPWMMMNGF